MPFHDLASAMYQRLIDYRAFGNSDLVTGDAVLAEAERLWQVSTPADPENPSLVEIDRLTQVRSALGWLHLYRISAGNDPDLYYLELARSLWYLWPLGSDQAQVPSPLRSLLGPTADRELQASTGTGMVRRAMSSPESALLDIGVALLTDGLANTPEDHPDRPDWSHDLGVAHRIRHQRHLALADLDRAIELHTSVAMTINGKDPRIALVHAELGEAYRLHYDHSGLLTDLDRAIEFTELAVRTRRLSKSQRAISWATLGMIHRQRWQHAGVPGDLDRAIECGNKAVATATAHHGDRPVALAVLGATYQARFEQTSADPDLDRAIELAQQAMECAPDDDPGHWGRLSELGNAYRIRFELRRRPDDLRRAITYGEQSVSDNGAPQDERPRWLANLANGYQVRFELHGAPEDLDRAIALGEQAFEAPITSTGPS